MSDPVDPGRRASVSVVIPAYGHGPYIVATIESVLAQTVQPLEIIVVNDGSPDDTEERLAPLIRDGRIRYVRQANAGQATARNRGAAMARGDYLAFLDDDDLWPPDALGWRVAALEADPALGVVFGQQLEFAGEPPAVPASPTTPPGQRLEWLAFFAGCPMVSPGLALIRRSAFEAVGGFAPDIWSADDWDLWFRLARHAPVQRHARVCLLYRRHQTNASRNVTRHLDNIVAVVERHVADVPAADQPVVRFVGLTGVSSTFRPGVVTALGAFLRRGAWSDAVRTARTLVRLDARAARARIALKWQLLRRRRWQLDRSDPVVRALFFEPSR